MSVTECSLLFTLLVISSYCEDLSPYEVTLLDRCSETITISAPFLITLKHSGNVIARAPSGTCKLLFKSADPDQMAISLRFLNMDFQTCDASISIATLWSDDPDDRDTIFESFPHYCGKSIAPGSPINLGYGGESQFEFSYRVGSVQSTSQHAAQFQIAYHERDQEPSWPAKTQSTSQANTASSITPGQSSSSTLQAKTSITRISSPSTLIAETSMKIDSTSSPSTLQEPTTSMTMAGQPAANSSTELQQSAATDIILSSTAQTAPRPSSTAVIPETSVVFLTMMKQNSSVTVTQSIPANSQTSLLSTAQSTISAFRCACPVSLVQVGYNEPMQGAPKLILTSGLLKIRNIEAPAGSVCSDYSVFVNCVQSCARSAKAYAGNYKFYNLAGTAVGPDPLNPSTYLPLGELMCRSLTSDTITDTYLTAHSEIMDCPTQISSYVTVLDNQFGCVNHRYTPMHADRPQRTTAIDSVSNELATRAPVKITTASGHILQTKPAYTCTARVGIDGMQTSLLRFPAISSAAKECTTLFAECRQRFQNRVKESKLRHDFIGLDLVHQIAKEACAALKQEIPRYRVLTMYTEVVECPHNSMAFTNLTGANPAIAVTIKKQFCCAPSSDGKFVPC